MTGTQLNNEFRPYYTVRQAHTRCQTHTSMYPPPHMHVSSSSTHVVRQWVNTGTVQVTVTDPDASTVTQRLTCNRSRVNTGTVQVTVTDPDAATTAYNMTPADNTFSNTLIIRKDPLGVAFLSHWGAEEEA